MGSLLASIFVACFAPSLAWLAYWSFRSRLGRRRLRPALAFFGAGLLAGPISLGLFELLELTAFYDQLGRIHEVDDALVKLAYAVFGIGLIEEFSKFLVTWGALGLLGRDADPRTAGPVYAAGAALGFATIENWYYMLELAEVAWVRALILPFNHVLFSSFWGVGLALYDAGHPNGPVWLLLGLLVSCLYHGLYDYIVLSPAISNWVVSGMLLVLWLWMVAAMSRLRRHARVRAEKESAS